LHTDDILENINRFENQKILFVHLSLKYRAEGIAVKLLREALPKGPESIINKGINKFIYIYYTLI